MNLVFISIFIFVNAGPAVSRVAERQLSVKFLLHKKHLQQIYFQRMTRETSIARSKLNQLYLKFDLQNASTLKSAQSMKQSSRRLSRYIKTLN